MSDTYLTFNCKSTVRFDLDLLPFGFYRCVVLYGLTYSPHMVYFCVCLSANLAHFHVQDDDFIVLTNDLLAMSVLSVWTLLKQHFTI